MKLRIACATFVFALIHVTAAADAEAKQHRYVGVHPIVEAAGGGTCYIEVPHVHVYPPQKVKVQYRVHDGWHHFVGDPVAHGFDGSTHAYHGAHPIHVDVVVDDRDWHGDHHVEWCYLKGPHYHGYAPGVDDDFVIEGEVFWYVGEYPDSFHEHRKSRGRINVVYEPIEYRRPEVVVTPPHGYVDVLVTTRGPGVHVEHPRHRRPKGRSGVHMDVHVPTPSIEVEVGGHIDVGTHGHRGHGKHKHRKHKHRKYKKHKKHKRWKH